MHSAKSLFDKNITSADECLALYDGIVALKTALQIDWILRAGVVFTVSALDAYFHDKVRYRVGRYSLSALPPALAKLKICISDVEDWAAAKRKGNVLRNWVTNDLSVKPLQKPTVIAETLQLAGINAFWDTIAPKKKAKRDLLDGWNWLVKRRNQIAHEGDRKTSRKSGKVLHPISRSDIVWAIKFAKDFVLQVEACFPG